MPNIHTTHPIPCRNKFWTVNEMNPRRLYLVEVAVLVVLRKGITVALIFPAYTYHFHTLSLNLYQNGAMDFSTDMTRLVRSLGMVALATMMVGALIGTAIGLTKATPNRAGGVFGSGLLQKLARQYSTEKGMRYIENFLRGYSS